MYQDASSAVATLESLLHAGLPTPDPITEGSPEPSFGVTLARSMPTIIQAMLAVAYADEDCSHIGLPNLSVVDIPRHLHQREQMVVVYNRADEIVPCMCAEPKALLSFEPQGSLHLRHIALLLGFDQENAREIQLVLDMDRSDPQAPYQMVHSMLTVTSNGTVFVDRQRTEINPILLGGRQFGLHKLSAAISVDTQALQMTDAAIGFPGALDYLAGPNGLCQLPDYLRRRADLLGRQHTCVPRFHR